MVATGAAVAGACGCKIDLHHLGIEWIRLRFISTWELGVRDYSKRDSGSRALSIRPRAWKPRTTQVSRRRSDETDHHATPDVTPNVTPIDHRRCAFTRTATEHNTSTTAAAHNTTGGDAHVKTEVVRCF